MDTVLEAADLTKHYEDFSLRGVSLTVRKGSISGLFGPNAAGKSTLLRMLAGQTPVPTGTLRVLGESFGSAERDLKNRIGYVPQEPVFFENQTDEWLARFSAPYFARWDGAGFYRLLDEFKVNPLKKVKHLSGGQKKLLSMAFALSHDAELLILDEPTAGLDVVHRRALLDRLRAFVADGDRTVLAASHITDGLDEIAEEIWFLDDGRVVAHEDKDDLLARWKWVHFKDGALPKAIEEGLVRVKRLPFGSSGLTGDYLNLRGALAGPLASGDVKLDNATLEDVLLSFIKGA
jgi:ABC-2 type transport system ATP-binding protein